MKYLVYRYIDADTEQEAIKKFRYGVGEIKVVSGWHAAVINRDKIMKAVQRVLDGE